MLLSKLVVFNQKEEECRQLADYFEESGYGVVCCSDMDELAEIIGRGKYRPDMFIFYMDGTGRRNYEIIDTIRSVSDMAILVVSEDSRLDTQLYAYSKKIDDYMTGVVPLPLLEAHVEAILRRLSKKKLSVETVGELTIDYESRKLFLEGKMLRVTAKEFDLMEYFIKHKGMVLSRDKILDAVWGYDYIGGYRSVDTLVKKLRAKLTKKYPYIQTIYGVGYSFDV